MTCRIQSLSWVFAGPLLVFSNGDQARHIELVFRCEFVEGEPRPDMDETYAARWWPLVNLPHMLPQHLKRVLIAAKGLERAVLGLSDTEDDAWMREGRIAVEQRVDTGMLADRSS